MGTPNGDRIHLPPSGAILVVCIGVFIGALDQTSVVTALPAMMTDLGLTIDRLDDLAWVVTSYLLGFTVAMPLLGRVGDTYGSHHLYLGALVLFAAGSLLAALAPSLEWLLASRIIQAIGGGALLPAAITIACDRIPRHRWPVVFGVIGASAEAGAVLGPLYGGIITDWIGWRWIFWTNIPLVTVLASLAIVIPKSRRSQGRLDLLGGLLLATGLVLIVVGLGQRALFHFDSMMAIALVSAGVLVVLALVIVERRAEVPIVATALFRQKVFVAALSTQFLVGGALVLALVTIPLMANTILSLSPLEGGLRLMKMTGAIPIGVVLSGYLVRRVGVRIPTLIGLILALGALLLMSTWDTTTSDPYLSIHLAGAGLGFGLVIPPLIVSAIDVSSDSSWSTSAAWSTASRTFGMSIGLAVLTAWGMNYFQMLASGLTFPALMSLGSDATFEAQITTYELGIADASLRVFSWFFRIGALLVGLALIPAMYLVRAERETGPLFTSIEVHQE